MFGRTLCGPCLVLACGNEQTLPFLTFCAILSWKCVRQKWSLHRYIEGSLPIKYSRRNFVDLEHAISYASTKPIRSRHKEKKLMLKHPACTAHWFQGHMGKQDTEVAVLSGGCGDFVIRKSSGGESCVDGPFFFRQPNISGTTLHAVGWYVLPTIRYTLCHT